MRKPRSKNDAQYGMDYSSRDTERWAMLESLDLGVSSAASHLGFLLDKITRIAGDGELKVPLWWLEKTLRLPERSIRRVIETGERIGVLLVRSTRRGDGSKDVNALAVNWSRIASRTIEPIGRPSRKKAASDHRPKRPVPPATLDAPERPLWPEPSGHVGRTPPDDSPVRQEPPPPAPAAAVVTWEAVEADVASLGITDWKTPIRAARDAGVTPDYVLRVVQHYRAADGGFGLGALQRRIGRSHPSLGPTDGWPPPKKSPHAGRNPPACGEEELQRTIFIKQQKANGVPHDAAVKAWESRMKDPNATAATAEETAGH